MESLMAKSKTHPGLTLLKKSSTKVPRSPASAQIESFANKHHKRDYIIKFDAPEFTTLCPVTGQPDFGHIVIEYVPDKLRMESKSLKLYLYSFRNYQCFHEESVNRILEDVSKAIEPRWITVSGKFRPRGGISIEVEASWDAEDNIG